LFILIRPDIGGIVPALPRVCQRKRGSQQQAAHRRGGEKQRQDAWHGSHGWPFFAPPGTGLEAGLAVFGSVAGLVAPLSAVTSRRPRTSIGVSTFWPGWSGSGITFLRTTLSVILPCI